MVWSIHYKKIGKKKKNELPEALFLDWILLREPRGLPLRFLEISVETEDKGGAEEDGTTVSIVATCDSPLLMVVALMVGCCGS
jgi:hypothetical protein